MGGAWGVPWGAWGAAWGAWGAAWGPPQVGFATAKNFPPKQLCQRIISSTTTTQATKTT